MTTKSTYEEHQSAIKLDTLSKTFREAVQITQMLGMRYLWIDSLCILQDNEADWENEAANMGLVFEQASYTIAAAAALNGTMGCFAQNVNLDSLILLPADARNPNRGNVYFAKNTNTVPFFDQGPLFSRAWVMQERLLSGRILHFAPDQVYWECREIVIGGDGAKPHVSHLYKLRELLYETHLIVDKGKVCTNIAGELIKSYPRIWFVNFWSELIESYSKSGLTVPTDKIPALQGLADRIKAMTGLIFASGIFFDDSTVALRALLWRRFEGFLLPSCAWRALSWSWASLDGHMAYRYEKLYNDDDRVRSPAHLVLRPLAEIVQLPGEESPSGPFIISAPIVAAKRGEVAPPFVHSTWRSGSIFGTPETSYRVKAPSISESLSNRVCFDVEDNQPSDFFIAALFDSKLGHRAVQQSWKGDSFVLYGLALAKQENEASRERYHRIGLAMIALEEKRCGSGPEATIIQLV